jgi:hypothetical protein
MPDITHGTPWPYILLGVGYGALAIAVLVAGAIRQERTAAALRRNSYSELSLPLVRWMTGGALALAFGTLIVILAKL